MPGEFPHFQDPEYQKAVIRETTGYFRYKTFYQGYFHPIGAEYYLEQFRDSMDSVEPGRVPEDYFRLMTLTSMLGAQFGFESMSGHLRRHKGNNWKKGEAFSPRHLLELCVYLARLNCQAFRFKDKIARCSQEPEISLGIWGVVLNRVTGGTLSDDVDEEYVQLRARDRFRELRPICVTDRILNHQISRLGQIGFYGRQALLMTDLQIKNEIFSPVSLALSSVLDIEKAFEYKPIERLTPVVIY